MSTHLKYAAWIGLIPTLLALLTVGIINHNTSLPGVSNENTYLSLAVITSCVQTFLYMGALVIFINTPSDASFKLPCIVYLLCDAVVFATFTLLLLAFMYDIEAGLSFAGTLIAMIMNMTIAILIVIAIAVNATMMRNVPVTATIYV